jgi:hypothetical protein
MRQATWAITDTMKQTVMVLRETDTEAQIKTATGRTIWVNREGLTEEK